MKQKNARATISFLFLMLLVFCYIFFNCSRLVVFGEDYNGDVVVYFAENSEVYHREGCSHFHDSDVVYYTTLEDAVYGYELRPCKRCHPAILGEPSPHDWDPYIPPEEQSNSTPSGSNDNNLEEDNDAVREETEEESNPLVFPAILTGIAVIGGGTFINGRVQENKRQKKREKDRAKFIELLNGRSIREAAGVPSDIRFFEGMPRDNNNRKYGSYTRYLSKSGNCYHEKQGCSSASKVAHAFNVAYRYKPCAKCCRSRVIIPEWYENYRYLEKEAIRLDIDKDINVSQGPQRRRVIGQLDVVQNKPETKVTAQVRPKPEKSKTRPAPKTRPEFVQPETKPVPQVQKVPEELQAKQEVAVKLPERTSKLRMVSFDINSNGRVEGKLNGKPVTFNSVWGQHTFTEEEIIRLLNDQSITFQYTTKKGKTRTATGKLGYGTGKYASHFGFQPEDF